MAGILILCSNYMIIMLILIYECFMLLCILINIYSISFFDWKQNILQSLNTKILNLYKEIIDIMIWLTSYQLNLQTRLQNITSLFKRKYLIIHPYIALFYVIPQGSLIALIKLRNSCSASLVLSVTKLFALRQSINMPYLFVRLQFLPSKDFSGCSWSCY